MTVAGTLTPPAGAFRRPHIESRQILLLEAPGEHRNRKQDLEIGRLEGEP